MGERDGHISARRTLRVMSKAKNPWVGALLETVGAALRSSELGKDARLVRDALLSVAAYTHFPIAELLEAWRETEGKPRPVRVLDTYVGTIERPAVRRWLLAWARGEGPTLEVRH